MIFYRLYTVQGIFLPRINIFQSIIYFLQFINGRKKLNHRIYSKQEKIMSNFVQATNHDVHMYAKLEYLGIYRSL
jgi:hypothetical protein